MMGLAFLGPGWQDGQSVGVAVDGTELGYNRASEVAVRAAIAQHDIPLAGNGLRAWRLLLPAAPEHRRDNLTEGVVTWQ
jgi:hypothetical protein